jgi:twitching motility two-component system response regulator PilH
MGSSQPKLRILIVEDDEFIARTFERMLIAAGFLASVSLTAEDALAQIAERPPDALLLDFRLPRINALGLLYRIRHQERFSKLPVLVVTGTPLSDETLDELSALRATVRYKPVGLTELVSNIDELFNAG